MDLDFLVLLQNFRDSISPFWTDLFATLTQLGEFGIIFPVVACLYWCGYKALANQIIFCVMASTAINGFLKITFCVSRPWLRSSLIVPVDGAMEAATGYSFPSGHTSAATSFYGTLAVWFKKRKVAVILCALAIALVMFSRIWLGVHTPQDVLASFLVTTLVVFVGFKAFKFLEQSDRNLYVFLGLCTLAAIALIIYGVAKPFPATLADGSQTDVKAIANDSFRSAGAMIGFVIGFFVERKFIKFNIPKKKLMMVARCLPGLVAFKLSTDAVAILLSSTDLWVQGFATTFYAVFFAMVIWPLIFKFFDRKKQG